MKKKFSSTWKSSKQPRKQRKYRHKAPVHVQQKFMSINLTKDLRKQHIRRSVEARVGDTVKVLRGGFKGKQGAIERINRKDVKVFVTGVESIKKDGSKTLYPLNPSNLQLQSLDVKDKRRFKDRTKKAEKKEEKAPEAAKASKTEPKSA